MKVFASLVVASLLVGLLGVCAYLYGENCEQTERLDALEMAAVRQADRLLLEAKIDSRLADERFFSRTVDQLDNQVQSLTRKVESLQETVQRSLGSSYTSSSLSTLETTGRNLESKVNEMSYDINKLKHEVNEIKFNIWSMKSQNNLH